MQKFKVHEDNEIGIRLDVFLSNKLPNYSRAYVQKYIDKSVKVNEEDSRSSYKTKFNDLVEIDLAYDLNPIFDSIEIPIIYEDNNCIVIDKPLGLLSHSKGNYSSEATVESFIADKITGFNGSRAGIVHRLDRGTSGVMICAKNPESYIWLQKQFSTRKVKKTYFAIITGKMSQDEAIIDLPIARNPKSPATFKVSSNGKEAITRYKVIKTSPKYSLIRLEPKTGRTHQLRVHLSYLGHSIVGDTFYKGKTAERLYLHANALEIKLPNNEIKVFESPIPKEFIKLLKNDNV